MSVTPIRPETQRHRTLRKAGRVYAIAFDLNGEMAARLCGDKTTCYGKIERVFAHHGFTRQQGSLYFGTADSDAVSCFKAVQDVDNKFPWFSRVVSDIRMLRVDEYSDLRRVLRTDLRFDSVSDAA